jgi:hypothetical protein
MAWVRLDDGFSDHPKIKSAGPLAIAAQVRALCYSARFLTNGRIPAQVVNEIFLDLSPLRPGDMVLAKLWQKRGKGYLIHDYLSYNYDRRTVLQMRETRARSGRMGGLAKAVADATAHAIANGKASGMPPNPYPSHTQKTEPSKEIVDLQMAEQETKKRAALELLKRAGLNPPKD